MGAARDDYREISFQLGSVMFRILTGVFCALIVPIYGFSLYRQLSQVPDLSGNVFWFLAGGLVMGILFMWTGPSLIRLVVMHELNHAIAGWLMGAKVRSVEASDSKGGAVQAELDSWGGEMISLAPYFFQPAPLALAGVKAVALAAFDPVICFVMGMAWAGFYFDMWFTLQVPQTDIIKTGKAFSVLVIVAMNLVFSGVVLCSVSPETSVVGFLKEGPVALYRLLALYSERTRAS